MPQPSHHDIIAVFTRWVLQLAKKESLLASIRGRALPEELVLSQDIEEMRLEIQTWMSVPAMFPSICQTPLPSAAGSGRPHYQVLFAAENALVKYPSHILYEIDAQGNRSAGQVIVPLNGPQGLGLIRYGLPVGHPRFPLPPAVRDLDVKQTDAGKKQEHAKALNDHREAVNRYWEYARLPLYKTKQAIESSGQPEPFDAAYSIYHPDYMRSQLGYGTIKKRDNQPGGIAGLMQTKPPTSHPPHAGGSQQ